MSVPGVFFVFANSSDADEMLHYLTQVCTVCQNTRLHVSSEKNGLKMKLRYSSGLLVTRDEFLNAY